MAGALAVAPAVAQTETNPSPPAAQPEQTVPGSDMNSPSRSGYNDNEHGFNFGWIGLVGLVGLLGLRRPHRSGVDRASEPRNIDNTGPGGIR